MKIINKNPYRIAGILSNATAREIEKQKAKIKAFSRVGKKITSEYDFNFLDEIERNEQVIDKAFSQIEQNKNKVNHSLFWFSNKNPIDKIAIDNLIKGNDEKAIEIWEKITQNKEINTNNFEAFNNLGTIKLLSNSEFEIQKGIKYKVKLITSNYFENFVDLVADKTFKIDNQKQTELFISQVLTELKNKYSISEQIQLFNKCDDNIRNYVTKLFTEDPIHNIEVKIEKTKKKRVNDKGGAYDYAMELINDTKDELATLKSLLDPNDLKYKMIADKLAKEILQCGIDCFNENYKYESDNEILMGAMELAQKAKSIAVSDMLIDRIKDNIQTLEEIKDKALSKAIDLLQSIKDAYTQNELKLLIKIKEEEDNLPFGQSINWSKVTEIINNSLDWKKVIELIEEVIPIRNIEKIKNSDNSSKKDKYKELVNFVLEKIKNSNVSYSYKNKVKYLKYWSETKPTTSITSTNEFDFTENAFWIFGIAGIIIGLMMGLGWGSLITGFIGMGIAGKLFD